jgi:hypothetical protein
VKLAHHPHVLWDTVDETVVLCNTDTVEFYELNPVGAYLWRACNGVDLEEIIGVLTNRYSQIDPAKIASDVRSYLTALIEANLLRVVDKE